ncbi:EEF1A lysine methyltransferase 1-like isoform X2 [Eriocheir sinensis]|uniref:EEF1A lysine methyltransferase 1-like isoform X2 n=1 Tax=Eriocheir sinensis TaxID=95602 RepID=UPI0021C9D17D|nr:EEF1A lysine methyltransferase 1-like isoform X2 [Eriocheir sinensis]
MFTQFLFARSSCWSAAVAAPQPSQRPSILHSQQQHQQQQHRRCSRPLCLTVGLPWCQEWLPPPPRPTRDPPPVCAERREGDAAGSNAVVHGCVCVIMNSMEEIQNKMREEEQKEESEEEEESCSLSFSASQDSEAPQLSAATLGALLEFYSEEEERKDKLREVREGNVPEVFTENWNLSQFWYSESTSQHLAQECLRAVSPSDGGGDAAVACLSCPTLYRTLRAQKHQCKLALLEYDTRFSCFGDDFFFYDFRSPLALDPKLRCGFDLVVADPPYLSADCLTKTSLTIRFLSKPDGKVILLTGAVMADLAERLLGTRPLKSAPPVHHSNNLGNPFVLYANYGFDDDDDDDDDEGKEERERKKREEMKEEEEEEERDRKEREGMKEEEEEEEERREGEKEKNDS